MNRLMSEYIDRYNTAEGSDVAKIKYLLMYFSHQWGLSGDDAFVMDLLDDANITAADIVVFLESVYAIDGGNKEFSCAIQAMKVCLQKAKMQDATPITEDMGGFEDIDGGRSF
jgi:hypothetical protein